MIYRSIVLKSSIIIIIVSQRRFLHPTDQRDWQMKKKSKIKTMENGGIKTIKYK